MRTTYKTLCEHAETLSRLSGHTVEVHQGAPQGGKKPRGYAITIDGRYDLRYDRQYTSASNCAARLIERMAEHA